MLKEGTGQNPDIEEESKDVSDDDSDDDDDDSSEESTSFVLHDVVHSTQNESANGLYWTVSPKLICSPMKSS